MKDKLTKKRIKVDYILVIEVAGLSDHFLEYQLTKGSRISLRRQALAFCLKNKVDIDGIYSSCLEHGVKSSKDYLDSCIKIASFNAWED